MRFSFTFFLSALLVFVFSCGTFVNAQGTPTTLSANLSLGSRNAQVTLLQQILNRDPDTRITGTGPGSLGNETNYFGSLTKAAVVRFQEKYAGDVLSPAGLSQSNGFVGTYTRSKLNSLSEVATSIKAVSPSVATSTPHTGPTLTDYVVKENEKIDIYAGDKKLVAMQAKLLAAINAGITSKSSTAITMPTVLTTDVPGVVVKTLLPQSGVPGTRVTIAGDGILSSSTVYLGSDNIIRTLDTSSGNFSFSIPSLPPGRYDLAVVTNGEVSRTMAFVITDPKNPPVHLQDISPASITYDSTLTITGSGFSPEGNVVVTNFQEFTSVPSPDGKTLMVQVAPEKLREAARVGNKSRKVLMYLYVVNNYGFSDSKKSFTMTL